MSNNTQKGLTTTRPRVTRKFYNASVEGGDRTMVFGTLSALRQRAMLHNIGITSSLSIHRVRAVPGRPTIVTYRLRYCNALKASLPQRGVGAILLKSGWGTLNGFRVTRNFEKKRARENSPYHEIFLRNTRARARPSVPSSLHGVGNAALSLFHTS